MQDAPDCRDWRPSLAGYLSGDLEPHHRRRLAAHLQHCPACREQLADLRPVITALKALGATPGPPTDGPPAAA